MCKLKFYEVDKNYINYLKQFDSKIPNIDYDKHDKFICGILFNVNDINYYAPISSFNKQQKTNVLIKNKKKQVTSSIRLSFMFPVPTDCIKDFDISKEHGFYKYLLIEELDFCNKNSNKIINKALHIYDTVINGKDLIMQKNCCNFKALEKAYLQYINQTLKKDCESSQNISSNL